MKILILFAIITLVLFLIMIVLKQDVLVSIVVSVLLGLILSYFLNNIDINYKKKDKKNKDKDLNDIKLPENSSTNIQTTTSSDYSKSFFLTR